MRLLSIKFLTHRLLLRVNVFVKDSVDLIHPLEHLSVFGKNLSQNNSPTFVICLELPKEFLTFHRKN